MKGRIRNFYLCSVITLFSLSGLAANGSIKGVVRDGGKNTPVEGASVVAKSASGAEKVEFSAADGSFTFTDLPAGVYTISSEFGASGGSASVTVADDQVAQVSVALLAMKTETYTITATGSLLGATAKDSPIPLYGLDREAVKKKGDPTVLDQVKALPIGGPVFGDANPFDPNSQFRPGSGTINIRGLGAPRTLVLLNGRRFSANNRNAPDTNLLPSSVIGRVEILKDGGAATYGSDALAGVANFFTRQDINGLEFSADYRQVTGSVGDVNASAAWGRVWDGGNFLASAAYQFRGELQSVARDWSYATRIQNPTQYSPYNNPGLWLLATTSAPPPVVGPAWPVFDGGSPLQATNSCTAMGGEFGYIGQIPFCYSSFSPYYNLVNEQHQVQLYGELNTKVGSKSKLHIDALYAMTNLPNLTTTPAFPVLTGPTGPGTPYIVPSSVANPNTPNDPSTRIPNPYFQDFLNQVGPVLGFPPPGTPLFAIPALFAPYGIGGNPSGEMAFGGRRAYSKNEEIRISGELSGPIGLLDINYRLGATYLIEGQLGSFADIVVDRLNKALNGLGGPNCRPDPNTGNFVPGANGCEWFNPFANGVERGALTGQANPGFVAGNANNVALSRWLDDYDRELRLRTDLGVFDGIIDGRIPFSLPGGEPTWALGGQYRRSTAYTWVAPNNPLTNPLVTPCQVPGVTNCAVKTGPYIFSGQYTPSFVQQDVYALFGQLDIPMFDAWKSQIGLRFEDYGSQTGSTINPQFRTKWQIFDVLALRGSIGTSFRGPTSTNVAPGLNVTQLSPVTAAGGGFKANDVYGNPNLKPEKAFSFNVGSIFQWKNFTTTIDYWFYKIDDQIAIVPYDLIGNLVGSFNGTQFANCASPLVGFVAFNQVTNPATGLPTNNCVQGVTIGRDISRIRSDTVNGPSLTTMGLDIDADYLIENVFGGALNLGAFASIMLKYEQDAFMFNGVTLSPSYDAVGYTNYDRLPGTIPRWRGQFFVNYNHGWHNVRVSTDYTDGATDNRGPIAFQTGPSSNCTVANVIAGNATNCVLSNFGTTLPGFVSLDVTYQLSLPWDMTVTVSGFNLIGMDPPNARLTFGYDPFIGNPLGRTFKFGITQKF